MYILQKMACHITSMRHHFMTFTLLSFLQQIEKNPQNHAILKVKFLSKNSILTKPQRFHEFFTQNFLDNFSHEIKVVNS